MYRNQLKRTFLICFVIFLSIINAQRQKLSNLAKLFRIVERDGDIYLQKQSPPEPNGDIFLQKQSPPTLDLKDIAALLNKNTQLQYNLNNLLKKDEGPVSVPLGKGLNKALVKRVVPHVETPSPDLLYDAEKNIYYRPLYRVHKKKRNLRDLVQDLVAKNDVTKKEDVPLEYILAPQDEATIKPKHKKNLLSLTVEKAARQLLRLNDLISVLQSSELKRDYRHKLQANLLNLDGLRNDVIRSIDREEKLRQGEGQADAKGDAKGDAQAPHQQGQEKLSEMEKEKYYTIAPGFTFNFKNDGTENVTYIPYDLAKWHVPLTNYWTYKKTIVEDQCPNDQVKLGPVCIKTPPHKKK